MNYGCQVSVVMGIYNASENMRASFDSISLQEGVDFELIVVDDGSNDGTADLIRDYAERDSRIVVITQENTGLTRALIRGCNAARGKYIARQDAGDLSEPSRLARQFSRLESGADAVLVSCGTQYVAPGGETLQVVSFNDAQIASNLSDLRHRKHISHHGSAMFRRCAYEEVGGYRSAFLVAQDYDLWLRLSEVGTCIGMTELLYTATLNPGSISAQRRAMQAETSEAIVRAAAARRNGESDGPILAELVSRRDDEALKPLGEAERRRAAAGWNYFIGCQLRRRDRKAAEGYFAQAIGQWWPHYQSWFRLLQCRFGL